MHTVTDGVGTFTDKASSGAADYTGVYDVTFTPTLAGTSFQILMRFNGLEVDSTADYRSNPLVVLPAVTPSAAHCNYTILPQPGQATTAYADQVASTSYEYTTGDIFNVILDSRDQYSNLRYESTADVFNVVLTADSDPSGAT
jgi:hypothetical protein